MRQLTWRDAEKGPRNASVVRQDEAVKKLIAPVALAAALVLTGCSGSDATSVGAASSKAAEKTPQTFDLTGAWKQSSPASKHSYQQATITADAINVEWVTEGGDTTSVYWVGTFDAPTNPGKPYTWTSQRDAAATDSALLASTDNTKEFTYKDGTISYKVSALRTMTTVNLERV